MKSSLYDGIREKVNNDNDASLERVEVNQRALIDKILARYASAGAVYRELLQNSNDADATTAEIYFTTDADGIVTQVLYRNNGMPFRPQDWSRLKKIAEGNPDVNKIGAFGVGAYTIFSICEDPLVISGTEALAFIWKGDSLWTKTIPNKNHDPDWTTFVLPSRDPYPLPSLVEFGEFLCASLTFTKCLRKVRVFVDDKERLTITKNLVQEPRPVQTFKSSSWLKNDGANTASPRGTFYLGKSDESMLESVYQVDVELDGLKSSVQARYVSAIAKTRIPADMARRMERVTKKQPPKEVTVQIFLNAQEVVGRPKNAAERITQSFSPQAGAGRIFIGFRTSQTTGLAAHLAAPFIPTVEREAMDLQDVTLRIFNLELLEFAGVLMRLTLEHTMSIVDAEWQKNAPEREKVEKELKEAEKKAKPKEQKPEEAKQESQDDASDAAESSTGGLMGFARFMARSAKKKIVSVINTVDHMIDDGSEFLNPKDPRPLSAEERQAIMLMQSFCPQQSTPDPLVGTSLAQGFSRCLPETSPPVLTRSGVVRGDQARLPHNGIEGFVQGNVIRSVVFRNAEEYHTVIARCRRLDISDLLSTVSVETFEEEKALSLIKWWTKYCRVASPLTSHGLALKEAIRYYPVALPADSRKGKDERPVASLKDYLFYVEKQSLLSDRTLPLPESVIPSPLQEKISLSTLLDPSLRHWFSPLPLVIWTEFISHHKCMTAAMPEDEVMRLEVLDVLNKEYSRQSPSDKVVFSGFCQGILGDKRCIPFDSEEPTQFAAEMPSDLYLYSAELQAFDGIGSFHKVSESLKNAGVSESFLLALGVRKSVSIDFLFANLDTLSWSNDPRPLVEYLRSATLTREDIAKLSGTQYLPAENQKSRTFAPSELYLPNLDLRKFPFIKTLQWPSESEVSERSESGKFLVKLGMKTLPPLVDILTFLSEEVKDDTTRRKCLDFLCDRLGPHGVYHDEYSRMRPSQKNKFRFLPCVTKAPLDSSKDSKQLHSPATCFSDEKCSVMGFSIIDTELGDIGKLYGSLLQCSSEPDPPELIYQLSHLVTLAKNKQKTGKAVPQIIIPAFAVIFKYLSQKSSDFGPSAIDTLKREQFIPCHLSESIEWYRPDQVFFRRSDGAPDSLTEELFRVIDFSPFLAATGVKQQATTEDIFQLMLKSPQSVLDTLGSEQKYRSLLRRVAANPPFSRVTSEIRNAPFLLAYSLKTAEKNDDSSPESSTYRLAKAEDIFIVDNSVFGRMFPVDRAPHESDLEDFYVLLGSRYISKSVDRRFEIVGKPSDKTSLTMALKERILERSPLLVSPSITSRPLVADAASIVSEKRLSVFEAPSLMAVYSLGGTVRRSRTTCFSRQVSGQFGAKNNAIYVVDGFDFFDLGFAIGDLILKRCQLEDAFFISSLLEAPLDQLRARGFPVDRILPKPAPVPEPTVADIPAKYGSPPPHGPAQGIDAEPVANSSATISPDKKEIQSKPNPVSSAQAAGPPQDESASQGFEQILKQMYPDAEENYIRDALGKNPSMDDVQRLATDMSSGNYPKEDITSDSGTVDTVASSVRGQEPPTSSSKKSKSGLRKKLGRFGGFLSSATPPRPPPGIPGSGQGQQQDSSGAGGGPAGPSSGAHQEHTNPVSPAVDAQSQNQLDKMLQNTVSASSNVNRQGVEAEETALTSIPEGLDRGETCEAIPGQSLKPFPGPKGSATTQNGIRVFSSRTTPVSEVFLAEHQRSLESFSFVLERLCSVFGLKLGSIAIFYGPSGGTIAFNSNRALHFNLRFFHSLHFLQNKHLTSECYSYWFVTTAHELAHHIVSAHNKEHGFYTESYISLYLPKLVRLLSESEDVIQ